MPSPDSPETSGPTMMTRKAWKTLPAPTARAALDFAATYDSADFARITRGLLPQAMEDKWFIFFEEPWLYLHRSWTGACIYGVRFEPGEAGFAAAEAWVSRDAEHYTGDNIAYDAAVLAFLIDGLLLDRAVPFPVRGDLPAGTPAGLYQHTVVGRAYPERSFEMPAPGSSFEARIREWWGKRREP